MQIMNYYSQAWKDFGNTSGRMSRKAYWSFTLIDFMFAFCLGFIAGFLGTDGTLGTIYILVGWLPRLTASIRRCHDAGYSGWFILVPLFKWVVLLGDSKPKNKWGRKPTN